MTTVLVTDGHLRSALAAVRSLGRAGYRVVIASPRAPSLAGSSRWAALEVPVPTSLREPHAFVHAVASVAHREGAALVLPMSEESLIALASAPDTAGLCIPYPALETLSRVNDKQVVLASAAALGMSVPRQTVARDRDGFTTTGKGGKSPVTVTAARSRATVWRGTDIPSAAAEASTTCLSFTRDSVSSAG